MLALRLLLVLSGLLIVISGGLYLFTRQPGYLAFAWKVVRFLGFALLLFAVLFLLERYALVAWRVLL